MATMQLNVRTAQVMLTEVRTRIRQLLAADYTTNPTANSIFNELQQLQVMSTSWSKNTQFHSHQLQHTNRLLQLATHLFQHRCKLFASWRHASGSQATECVLPNASVLDHVSRFRSQVFEDNPSLTLAEPVLNHCTPIVPWFEWSPTLSLMYNPASLELVAVFSVILDSCPTFLGERIGVECVADTRADPAHARIDMEAVLQLGQCLTVVILGHELKFHGVQTAKLNFSLIIQDMFHVDITDVSDLERLLEECPSLKPVAQAATCLMTDTLTYVRTHRRLMQTLERG